MEMRSQTQKHKAQQGRKLPRKADSVKQLIIHWLAQPEVNEPQAAHSPINQLKNELNQK